MPLIGSLSCTCGYRIESSIPENLDGTFGSNSTHSRRQASSPSPDGTLFTMPCALLLHVSARM
eukprot:7631871-Pyramimonas_sp.AAC.1